MVSRDVDGVQQPLGLLKCEQSRCLNRRIFKIESHPSHVTPLWPRALNICNRCQGFKSRWLLRYLFSPSLSFSSVRRYVCPSRPLSLCPSLFLSSIPSLSATLYFHPSFSLSLSLFLHSLIDSSCRLWFSALSPDRQPALSPSRAASLFSRRLLESTTRLRKSCLSPNVKADLFRTRDVCNDIAVCSREACYRETANFSRNKYTYLRAAEEFFRHISWIHGYIETRENL